MTELQADQIIAILDRIEFMVHAGAITLGLIFGVMCWQVIRHAMDRRNL